jgi:hypothetical protein
VAGQSLTERRDYATGYRSFMIQVTNISEITQQCGDAGVRVLVDDRS